MKPMYLAMLLATFPSLAVAVWWALGALSSFHHPDQPIRCMACNALCYPPCVCPMVVVELPRAEARWRS